MKKKIKKSKKNNKSNKKGKLNKSNKKIRKIIFMFLIISIIAVILIYKAPIFNVKAISFSGLVSLKEETLMKDADEEIGRNIFSIDYSEIKNKLLMNPYISDVTIKRAGINKLNINIKENKIAFYIDDNEVKKIINNKLIIVESTNDIDGKNLIKLLGVDANGGSVGDKVLDSGGISDVLMKLYPVIEEMPAENRFTSIDLSDLRNIKGIIGDVEIRLGNSENLINKMNTVLNIINQEVVTKGYIDVGFDGPPIIKQENK